MLTELTDSQKAALAVHARMWVDRVFEVRPADRARMERGILGYYSIAKLSPPKRIVWTNSPITAALAGPIASKILGGVAVSGTVRGTLHGTVDAAVRAASHGAVDEAVDEAVKNAVGGAAQGAVNNVQVAVSDAVLSAVRGAAGDAQAAVSNAVTHAVNTAVSFAVSDAVRGAVGDDAQTAVVGTVYSQVAGIGQVDTAVRGAVNKAVDDQWHWYLGGAAWPAWPAATATFYRDVCGLDLAPEATQAAEDATEGWWWWPHAEFVIVSERPTMLKLDAEGRLHSERGQAIEWSDGWGVSAWHGKVVAKEIMEQSGGAALARLGGG